MEIDWNSVKRQTLWNYEDLVGKLQNVLACKFVQQHYNHNMEQAQDYARQIRHGYLQDRGDMLGYIEELMANLEALQALHVGTYSDLIQMVITRCDCEDFIRRTNFDFNRLIQTLNYLLRWVLPFKNPLREFIDVDNEAETRLLNGLKKQKIGSNLDLLESGIFKDGRIRLSSATGVSVEFVTALVHKADISRLAYVRGKTIRHLCGGGYTTLASIADANLDEMEKKMDAYYRTLGKRLSDFKAVIPLAWMVGGAQILPPLFED